MRLGEDGNFCALAAAGVGRALAAVGVEGALAAAGVGSALAAVGVEGALAAVGVGGALAAVGVGSGSMRGAFATRGISVTNVSNGLVLPIFRFLS